MAPLVSVFHPKRTLGLASRHPEQIMFVAVFDGDSDDVAGGEVGGVAEVDVAVDFGSIGLGAAGGAESLAHRVLRRGPSTKFHLVPLPMLGRIYVVDDDIEGAADFGG